jgi:hypothetical protein
MKGLLLTLFFIPLFSHSQVLRENYYQKLKLEANETVIVSRDTLVIDSLIMGHRAKLTFTLPNTVVIVFKAYIGKDCTFDLSGQSGTDFPIDHLDPGTEGFIGEDGISSTFWINFIKLGSLTINAKGGDGGQGATGMKGRKTADGGSGGNGGSVNLVYGTAGITPNFNTKGKHAIIINNQGGQGGPPGEGPKNVKKIHESPPTVDFMRNNNPRGNGPEYSPPPGLRGVPLNSYGKKGADGKSGLIHIMQQEI